MATFGGSSSYGKSGFTGEKVRKMPVALGGQTTMDSCSGLTSWVLEAVDNDMGGVKSVAICWSENVEATVQILEPM